MTEEPPGNYSNFSNSNYYHCKGETIDKASSPNYFQLHHNSLQSMRTAMYWTKTLHCSGILANSIKVTQFHLSAHHLSIYIALRTTVHPSNAQWQRLMFLVHFELLRKALIPVF